MKIEEYLQKHELTQRDVKPEGSWIPASLTVPRDNKFRVFGNNNGTHVVVFNDTTKRFKIMHGEIVFLETDWLDAHNNFETDARPFWERSA